jgi:hypothetical protein
MVVTQQPAQSLAAPHRPLAVPIRCPRKQQDVALTLVISLGMEMLHVFAERPPQRWLAEQDHLGQALLLDRPDPTFGVGVQVRAACRQRQRLNPTGCNDGTERSRELGVPIVQERQSRSAQQSSMVTFRAICFIHASLG